MSRQYAGKLAAVGAAAAAQTLGRRFANSISYSTSGAVSARKSQKRRDVKLQKIYVNPSTLLSKRFNADFSYGLRPGNQLTVQPLNQISQGDTLDQRTRQVINIRGVKIWYMVKNSHNEVSLGRWAICRFKNNNSAPTATTVGEDFFRGHFDARQVNFDAVISGPRKHTYGLNTDKFEVFAQGKFTLAPDGTNTSDQANMMNSMYVCDKYIPINKLFHYEGSSSTDGTDSLFFVTWNCRWNEETAVPRSNEIESIFHSTVYYQD